MLDTMIRNYGMTMPAEMYRSGGRVGAAFNRQMGPNARGDLIVAYFDADYRMFAWSYMLDRVTDIGKVADGWPINSAMHQWDGYQPGQRMRCVVTLVRPMVDGDL